MPFIAAPNIVELQFRYTLQGERAMNRIHVNVGAVPNAVVMSDLADAALAWWTSNVRTIVSDTLALREVYLKSLHAAIAPEVTITSGLPSSGTMTVPPLPSSVSLAVSLRSNQTGRSARGRWFWCGFAEDQVDGNIVTGGTITSIDAALTNLKNEIDGLGHTWVVVSFFSGGVPRPGGPVYSDVVTIAVVDPVVDSQRRRLPGRGQ